MVATVRTEDIDEILPGVVADRRWLHENPELGFEEVKTSGFVADRLRAIGIEEVATGVNRTGVVGIIRGNPGGKTLLLRADMDALPIHEENEVEYRSQTDGVMHACGHDAHTAILLAVARLLHDRKSEFTGTVKVLFQPSEERQPGGAKGMIEAGVLENPHVDEVYGLHMANDTPVGIVGVADGPALAAADSVTIDIQGKGGHGAAPHETVDPVVIGAQVISALQTLVSREVDPTQTAVVSITTFHSGHAFNVIPDTAKLTGTVRTFDPAVREHLSKRIGEVASSVASGMGGSAVAHYDLGYPPTINHPEQVEVVRRAAREVLGAEHVQVQTPMMAGEDFSYFLYERPGAFFMVGSMNTDKGFIWSHHHPKFDIDEDSMGIGIQVMMQTVLTALGEGAN